MEGTFQYLHLNSDESRRWVVAVSILSPTVVHYHPQLNVTVDKFPNYHNMRMSYVHRLNAAHEYTRPL